jgi:RNA polymerase sigma-70 factor, ECF subfamily
MAQEQWPDETDLVAGLRARDAASLETVIKLYSRELFYFTRLILNGVGSVQDAEECLNDLFVVVWQEFDSFDPKRSSLRTWLTMRAKYIALDKRRYLQRRKGHHGSSETTVVSLYEEYALVQDNSDLNTLREQQGPRGEPMTAGVDTLLEEREQREELRQALERLSELDRLIVYLRYFHHTSIEEIAERTGISKHAVDTHLWRARKNLRGVLQEQVVYDTSAKSIKPL